MNVSIDLRRVAAKPASRPASWEGVRPLPARARPLPADDRSGRDRRAGTDRRQAAAPREDFLTVEPSLPAPVRSAAAARAFSAGNGYLTGTVIDRHI